MGSRRKKQTPRYRCHECDEWRPGPSCAECGCACALYVPAGRAALSTPGEEG